MGSSWIGFVSGCKSRWSALARSCFLRRRHWQQKYIEAKQALKELRELAATSAAQCRQLEQQQADLRQQVAELQRQLAEPRPVVLPLGETPPGQHYGANLMALSVNLARELGLRPARRAMNIFSRP